MGYLDPIPQRFVPPISRHKKYQRDWDVEKNLEALNNDESAEENQEELENSEGA